MRDIDSELTSAISESLLAIESKGELVITSASPHAAATEIAEKVREVYAGGVFTPEELMALSSLILHAVADKRFYDWEMPTLIGYSADEMKALGMKIRESVNL